MERIQGERNDLTRLFHHAKAGEVIPSGKGAKVSFSMDHGLLYRIYKRSTGMETVFGSR